MVDKKYNCSDVNNPPQKVENRLPGILLDKRRTEGMALRVSSGDIIVP